MQGVPFREDIIESGHSETSATARSLQTTSQELRTAVLPLETQVSATSARAVSWTASTTISTASTQVSATVTPVTTSDASYVSLQSAGSDEANSVEVESRFILLLVCPCFVLFVISRFRFGTVCCFRFRPVFCVHGFTRCRCLFP